MRCLKVCGKVSYSNRSVEAEAEATVQIRGEARLVVSMHKKTFGPEAREAGWTQVAASSASAALHGQ